MSSLLSGGRVKEPQVTFRRPLRVHSDSEKLAEVSKAWSSFGRTASQHSTLDGRHYYEDSGIANHYVPPHPHSVPDDRSSPTKHTRSHDHLRKRGRTSPDSKKLTNSSSLHSSIRRPLPDTIPAVHSLSRNESSPTRSNPRSVFSPPIDFRQPPRKTDVSPPTCPAPVAVNGTPLEPSRKRKSKVVTRKIVSKQGETKLSYRQRPADDIVENDDSGLKLSDEQYASLLKKIEQQKQEVALVRAKLESSPSTFSSSFTSHNVAPPTTHHVAPPTKPRGNPSPRVRMELEKKRKVASAPPPRSYSGFTVSSDPSSLSTILRTTRIKTGSKEVKGQSPPPSPPPPAKHPDITPTSWRSGQRLANQILGKRPGVASSRLTTLSASIENAKSLLKDLEEEEEEESDDSSTSGEEEKEIKKPSMKVSHVKPVHPVKQAVYLSESAPQVVDASQSREKTKNYDRDAVQRYMQSKQEERRLKLQEERLAQHKAQHERKKRLEELEERQKRIVTANLLAKQNPKDDQSSLLHIHLHSSPSSHDISPPSLIITPPTTSIATTITTSIHSPVLSTSITSRPVMDSFIKRTPSPVPVTDPPVTQNNTSLNTSPLRGSHSFTSSTPSPSLNIVSPSSQQQQLLTPPARVSHVASGISPPSAPSPREAKILELRSSALALKRRIEEEKRKMEEHMLSSKVGNINVTGSTHVSPSTGGTHVPPSTGSTNVPPSTGSTHVPPLTGSAHIPPSTGSSHISPSTGSTSVPPSTGGAHVPPSTGGTYATPLRSNVTLTSSLTKVTLPSATLSSTLTNVTLPSTLTKVTLPSAALPSTLTTVTLPSAALSSTLTKVTLPSAALPSTLTKVTLPSTLTNVTLPSAALPSTLTNVTLPFATLSSTLTNVTLPSTLTKVTLPSTLTKVTPSSYTSIMTTHQTIPNSVMPPYPLAPWQQSGGDHMSVINIFTRQQQQFYKQQRHPTVTTASEPSNIKSTQTEVTVGHMTSSHMEEEIGSHMTSSHMEEETGSHMTSSHVEEDDSSSDESTSTMEPLKSSPIIDSKQTSFVSPPKQESSSLLSGSLSPDSSSDDEISAITPPGKQSSFHGLPPKVTDHSPTELEPKQFSPRSLELRLKAELNILETVQEGVRQLEGVESIRAVAEAQQETVALAQILQSQRQSHQHTIQDLTDKAKLELKEAQERFAKAHEETLAMSRKVKELKEATEEQSRKHSQQMKQVEDESRQREILVVQKMTETTNDALRKQIEAAQAIVANVAKETASIVVKDVLKEKDDKVNASSYKSDFENDSLNTSLETSSAPITHSSLSSNVSSTVPIVITNVPSTVSEHVTNVPSTVSEHITNVPSSVSEHVTNVSSSVSGHVTNVSSSISEHVTNVPSSVSEHVTNVPSSVSEHVSNVPSTVSEHVSNVPSTVSEHVTIVSSSISQHTSSVATQPKIILSTPPTLTISTEIPSLNLSPKRPSRSSHSSDGTLTPEPVETKNKDGDTTLTSIGEDEKVEEIDEVSFRELLPSESHRRQRLTHSISSDTSDGIPLIGNDDMSPLVVGDESFSSFISRMVKQYVNEEEMRSRHQAALLKIREKAIKEKTKAELEWLKVKKRQLENKKDIDAMPPLLQREEGVLKKLKHEQAEIKRLREAQRRASQDRKLLLLQQQDITRLQQSAQHYKEKIRRYKQRSSREPSPLPDYSPCPSPAPSIDEDFTEDSISTSFADSLKHSSSNELLNSLSEQVQLEPPTKKANDTYKLKQLQQSSNETEKYLEKYQEKLKRRRKTAEDLLSYKQELLKKERELLEEEANISHIINEAWKIDETALPKKSQTNSEGSNEISEVISAEKPTSNDYSTDTFENTASLPLTSTPNQTRQPGLAQKTEEHSSVTSTSEGIDQEQQLLLLQKQLEGKERELKRKEVEQIRKKKEMMKKEEKELQTKLKLVENSLREQDDQIKLTTTTHEAATNGLSSTNDFVVSSEYISPIKHSITDTTASPITTTSTITSTIAIHVPTTSINTIHSTTSTAPPTVTVPPIATTSTPITLVLPTAPLSPVTTTTSSVSEHLESDNDSIHTESPPAISPTPEDEQQIMDKQEEIIDQQIVDKQVTDRQKEVVNQQVTGLQVEIVKQQGLIQQTANQQVVNQQSLEQEEQNQQGTIVITTTNIEEKEDENKDGPSASISTSQTSHHHLSPRPSPSPLSLTPDIIENFTSQFAIGQHVLVANTVKGTVRFIGETNFAEGVWIGVELDEARGKNDGSVNGRTYFSCAPRHGVFAPPSKIVALTEEEVETQEDVHEEKVEVHEEEVEVHEQEAKLHEKEVEVQEKEVKEQEVEDEEEVEELIEEESGLSQELSKTSEEGTPLAISPIQLSQTEEEQLSEKEHQKNDDDILTSVSQLSTEGSTVLNDVLSHTNIDKESQIDNITEQLTTQLSNEAYDTIHSIWTNKEIPPTSSKVNQSVVDKLTNDILTDLVASEVQVISDLKHDRESNRRPSRTSLSSELLALVPSTQPLVNRIVECAWNTVNDSRDHAHRETRPSAELVEDVCVQSDAMLECEKSFVHLVFNLAMDLVQSRKEFPTNQRPLTLAFVQEEVYAQIHHGKSPVCLPCVRYLHGNCRLGGKEVDFIDSILIRELRAEEPGWIDYKEEEVLAKEQTADSILDLLLEETVEVIESIYLRKKAPVDI